MWKVAIKGILAHKFRIVLTSIAVVLGVSFMTGTLVLSDTIGRTFDNLITNVNGGLSAQIRAKAAFKDEQGNEQRKRIDASLVDAVRKVPGVKDAEISVAGFAVIVGPNGKGLNASGNGPPPLAFAWDPSPTLNPVHLVAGKAPTAADDVVIDKHSADTTHYRVGDRIRIVTVSSTGTSAIYRLSGIGRFGTADSPAGATLTFFRPDVAERLLASPGKVDSIQIAADSGVSQATLVQRLRVALRGQQGIEVVTGASVVQEQQSNFHDQFKFFTVFLLVFAIVALIVGSFVIYNTFSITVAQRTRENALLRAVGASRRQITISVFLEALTTGVVASVIGLGLGVVCGVGAQGAAGRPEHRHSRRWHGREGEHDSGVAHRRDPRDGARFAHPRVQGGAGPADRGDARGRARTHQRGPQAHHRRRDRDAARCAQPAERTLRRRQQRRGRESASARSSSSSASRSSAR